MTREQIENLTNECLPNIAKGSKRREFFIKGAIAATKNQPSLESILELMGKVEEDGISLRLHSDGSGTIFRYPKELDVITSFRDLQELQSHLNQMLKE